MKHLRIWSCLAACTASVSLLLGETTVWKSIVCNSGTSEVYPIDLPVGQSPIAESPVTGIVGPEYVAITPDATKAVVSGINISPNPNIFGLNLVTNPVTISTSSRLPAPQIATAITPDGTKVYTTDKTGNVNVLNVNDLSTIIVIPQAAFGTYTPLFIALSPNKPEAYITTASSKVFVINTDTNTVVSSFDLLAGSHSYSIAVTPNGAEVYVSNASSNLIFYITLDDGVVHYLVGAASGLQSMGVAIAPDGKAVYVVQPGMSLNTPGQSESTLTKIDTSTHAIVEEFLIPTQLIAPGAVAISPDGKIVCITDAGSSLFYTPGQFVTFMDTTTGAASTLQLSSADQSALTGVSITPDPAPTARFSRSASGSTVTFDASASSSPIGTIATYAWDFGDGQMETTTTPTISHTYSTGGDYTVTLTVTNTGGTSTAVTFTGQTVSNWGGPSAVTTQQITVQTIGVTKFKGKVHRNHKEKKVYLKTKWSKSLIPNTRKYEIFERNKKIATVKANHKRHKTLRLHPHHFPHSVSKDYRHYLDHKYNIRVVNTSDQISLPTFVHVVKH
jgi:DNA-binding beta-propeller fold protein YncE